MDAAVRRYIAAIAPEHRVVTAQQPSLRKAASVIDQRDVKRSLPRTVSTLPDLTGTPHTLSALRGKKVFLCTWASW